MGLLTTKAQTLSYVFLAWCQNGQKSCLSSSSGQVKFSSDKSSALPFQGSHSSNSAGCMFVEAHSQDYFEFWQHTKEQSCCCRLFTRLLVVFACHT